MESQFQKWVSLSYLAVAALLGFFVLTLANKIVGAYDLETRMRNVEVIIQIGSVVCGAVLFFVLYQSDRANQFMNEVMLELSRVTWPTQKETFAHLYASIIMVLVSGMFVGFLDYCWTSLLKWIL